MGIESVVKEVSALPQEDLELREKLRLLELENLLKDPLKDPSPELEGQVQICFWVNGPTKALTQPATEQQIRLLEIVEEGMTSMLIRDGDEPNLHRYSTRFKGFTIVHRTTAHFNKPGLEVNEVFLVRGEYKPDSGNFLIDPNIFKDPALVEESSLL